MIDPPPPATSVKSAQRNPRRVRVFICVIAAILLTTVAVATAIEQLRSDRLRTRLLATNADAIASDLRLRAFAEREAKPLYAAHCAQCHGAAMRGDSALGAPSLIDHHWLYGDGSIFDIERTLLYGIRSGQSKSHHVTDMPAFGLTGRLNESEIHNLVQYLLQLRGLAHQSAAASDGRAVYEDVARANCADCHGDTARGDPDYGAPDLTVDLGDGRSDARVLYDAIYNGQHRVMPGWINVLTLEQIRALSVYVYLASRASGT
jgi:cytochrome c oxidase cbb3-type subunit III